MPTPLLDRINGRKPQPRPQPAQEWRRRALEQRDRLGHVAVTDQTGYVLGAFVPDGSERGA